MTTKFIIITVITQIRKFAIVLKIWTFLQCPNFLLKFQERNRLVTKSSLDYIVFFINVFLLNKKSSHLKIFYVINKGNILMSWNLIKIFKDEWMDSTSCYFCTTLPKNLENHCSPHHTVYFWNYSLPFFAFQKQCPFAERKAQFLDKVVEIVEISRKFPLYFNTGLSYINKDAFSVKYILLLKSIGPSGTR